MCNVGKLSVIPVRNSPKSQCQRENSFPPVGGFQPGKSLPTSPLTLVHSTLLDDIMNFPVRLPGNVAKLPVLHNSLLLAFSVYSLRES